MRAHEGYSRLECPPDRAYLRTHDGLVIIEDPSCGAAKLFHDHGVRAGRAESFDPVDYVLLDQSSESATI
jgi:hypothetical protein